MFWSALVLCYQWTCFTNLSVFTPFMIIFYQVLQNFTYGYCMSCSLIKNCNCNRWLCEFNFPLIPHLRCWRAKLWPWLLAISLFLELVHLITLYIPSLTLWGLIMALFSTLIPPALNCDNSCKQTLMIWRSYICHLLVTWDKKINISALNLQVIK